MPIVVNTNTNALLAQNYLTNNQAALSQAMQRLSSGLRINDAADDPAGLAIAVSMTQISSALQQGALNGNTGVSLVQTAQSAMGDISNLLTQMSTLASEASSGTFSSTQLTDLQTEFSALLSEVNRVASNTQFNGINLLNNSSGTVTIQVGSGNTSNDRLSVNLVDITTGSTGLNISSLNISSNSSAQSAIGTLTTALATVTTDLANLGASQTNLNAAVNNDSAIATSLLTAKSRIQDADFSAESTNFAKASILTQSNISMLAQANSTAGYVLKLLG